MPQIEVRQHGAGKKRPQNTRARKTNTRSSGRRSASAKKKPSRMSKKVVTSKTARTPPKRSDEMERERRSRACSGMNMTELQFLAKSRGIPFGGLTKTKLIRKINNYY